MRLSTRFGVGAALAVLPLVGVIGFSVERMQELARSNERLTLRQVVASQIASGVISRLERLEEYQWKHSVSGDSGYALKFDQTVAATGAELQELLASDLTPDESEAIEELVTAWEAFAERGPVALRASDIASVTIDLDHLMTLALDVQQRTRDAAKAEAEVAVRVREETRRTAMGVAGFAIALSAALILLTVRSIRTRLDQFIVATTAVSKGTFSFQMDERADDELGQVARAFNQMVRALQQLERIKADFISSVSHELRTPLVAMLETNLFMLDEVPGPLTDKQKRMLELNTQAAQRLSGMISDLLDLHRLKAGIRYRISEQEVGPLTQSAVSELEALARERGLALRAIVADDPVPQPGPMVVQCDPDRYVQVVQNLVENALKYTPSGGEVEVGLARRSCHALPPRALPVKQGATPECDYALLRVEDSGPGIPEPDRERVFEKFFRRQERASDGGHGLGLAICREIVEAHGGAIWVGDSRLGGAALNVALPLASVTTRKRTGPVS